MSIFIPPYVHKAVMETKGKDVPVGIIRPQGKSLDSVELRVALEKAVDDANLNVSERMALNKKFFPNGGGVPLFKEGETTPRITTYYKKGQKPGQDKFSKQIDNLKQLDKFEYTCHKTEKSDKGNYKTNLKNALNKLGSVLKGNL